MKKWDKKGKDSKSGESKKDGDNEKSSLSVFYSSSPGDPSTF